MDELALLPQTPTREQIQRLEAELLDAEAQGFGVKLETTHYFSPGIYAREIFIPAGTVLTGAQHKTEHLVLFVGDITVWHEGQMVRVTGHQTLVSKPGAKRVGFAHEDTFCTGFFPNPDECRDVRELEMRFVEGSHLLQNNRLAERHGGLECSESLQLPQQ